jgi:hypothetical protein
MSQPIELSSWGHISSFIRVTIGTSVLLQKKIKIGMSVEAQERLLY